MSWSWLFFWRRGGKRAEPSAGDAAASAGDKSPKNDLEEALTKALAEQGIHEGFRDTIRRLVFEDSDGWRRCCGSGCEPCVLQMERAVDDVRDEIRWTADMPVPPKPPMNA